MAGRRPNADTWSVSDVAQRELSRAGRFVLQRCGGCEQVIVPPSPVCPSCLAADPEWFDATPAGVVHTWTRFHRAYFDEMPAPYVCLAVELDDGPLFITGWDECCMNMTPTLGSRVGIRIVHFENVSLPLAHQVGALEGS